MKDDKNLEISEEMAADEFERFTTEMDIENDVAEMDDEDAKTYTRIRKRLIKAIVRGHLVIDEDGIAVYTPHRSGDNLNKPITFHEKDGTVARAQDGYKDNARVDKTYAMMGALTKSSPKMLMKLKGTDGTICQELFLLLMD